MPSQSHAWPSVRPSSHVLFPSSPPPLRTRAPQVFWDRALGMPLERPKSVTSEYIVEYFKNKK